MREGPALAGSYVLRYGLETVLGVVLELREWALAVARPSSLASPLPFVSLPPLVGLVPLGVLLTVPLALVSPSLPLK